MKERFLSKEEILAGHDAVSQLYPYVPPMFLWRAWEYAGYKHYNLVEPVLDVGCGDGRFFKLIWPDLKDVVGVDIDAGVVDTARRSRIYREVHQAPAHKLPIESESFASAFANCSLEHMDHLPQVLSEIRRSLRPGGHFLCSVVTDKLVEWSMLPLLIEAVGEPIRARTLQVEYEAYHHLVNPLPSLVWMEYLEKAGFEVLEHVPIVPRITSYIFLFWDQLWHVRQLTGELSDVLYHYLMTLPNFTPAFRQILAGILQMDLDWSIGSGAIFWARRS